MSHRTRHPRTRLLHLVVALATAAAPSAARAQSGTGQSPPLSATMRQRYVGRYTIAGEAGQPSTPLRVFEERGALRGQLRQNDPSPLVYQGGHLFRVASAPGVALRFTVEGGRATRVAIVSPSGTLRGVRDAEPPAGGTTVARAEPRDATNSGPLFDELARMDSLLFDASYVACDAARTMSYFADDAEFYHDRGGFHAGAQVRADFERLTADCPRGRGITRELVPGSLHVYPIADYGAVQVGEHRFVERGAPSATVARFTHLWRRQPDGGWKLTRVLSYDHAAAAAR